MNRTSRFLRALGSDGARQPLQVGFPANGTMEVHVKNKSSWIDLAGTFYYLRQQ